MNEIFQILDVIRMTSSGVSGFAVAALGFFLWKQGIITLGRGAKNEDVVDSQLNVRQIAEDISHLRLHYNDELTVMFKDFRETQLQQCAKLSELVDSVRDIQRNGIRIRKL